MTLSPARDLSAAQRVVDRASGAVEPVYGWWNCDAADGLDFVAVEASASPISRWYRTQIMPPTFGNGKICYIDMPATDIGRSAEFYERVFGWNVRTRGDGSVAFDDGVGQVSGTWTLGRPAATQPGFLIYVMVDSAAATCELVTANGGEIVLPVDPGAREVTALFRDPAGNVVGLYEQRG